LRTHPHLQHARHRIHFPLWQIARVKPFENVTFA
jgi:hypothetical protein